MASPRVGAAKSSADMREEMLRTADAAGREWGRARLTCSRIGRAQPPALAVGCRWEALSVVKDAVRSGAVDPTRPTTGDDEAGWKWVLRACRRRRTRTLRGRREADTTQTGCGEDDEGEGDLRR